MPKSRSALRLIDVANKAGVSLATASRSLSGQSGVSEEVARQVREVAREMGYVANMQARSLAGGATSIIGLIVHEIADPYFTEIASGVIADAEQNGLIVQISQSGRDPRQELRQVRALIANRAEAIIIAGSGYVDPDVQAEARSLLNAYQRNGGRIAVIGRHHLNVDAVRPANAAGARAITDHVLGLGHRHIVVAAGPAHLTTVVDRLEGVEAAVADHKGKVTLTVLHTAFSRVGGEEAARTLLEQHPKATALIALNDDMALGALTAFREAGVAVPDQVTVTGFDDVTVSASLAPPLTTVRLPLGALGRLALDLTRKPVGSQTRCLTTDFELVIRDSSAAPRR